MYNLNKNSKALDETTYTKISHFSLTSLHPSQRFSHYYKEYNHDFINNLMIKKKEMLTLLNNRREVFY